MRDPIYFDHAATTPVRAEVLEAMLPFWGPRFGNPSSVHRWGREARSALEEARERLATAIGAHRDEVVFTSGGTEADNLAILGAWHARRASHQAVVTSPTEHKAVLAAVHRAVEEGAEERLLPVDALGVVHPEAGALAGAALCSVMWVNNETGVVQDVQALGTGAAGHGALFHTDAVQAFGKVAIDVSKLPIDLLTVSGHKIGAPKGIGALFIKRGVTIAPLQHGGSQNRGIRPGTENVALAVGLARAAELAVTEMTAEVVRLRELQSRVESVVRSCVPECVIHGIVGPMPRAPHITSVAIPGSDSESMLMALDLAGVACSAGSACQSGSVTPSHVLTAMGIPAAVAVATIRISVGALSTPQDVERFAALLPRAIETARRLTGTGSSVA